jgi:hypothetical protein
MRPQTQFMFSVVAASVRDYLAGLVFCQLGVKLLHIVRAERNATLIGLQRDLKMQISGAPLIDFRHNLDRQRAKNDIALLDAIGIQMRDGLGVDPMTPSPLYRA